MAISNNDDAESSSVRAFSILECVVRASNPPTLDEITSVTGMPKPTVFRILATLQRAGLLHREPISKCYSPGGRMMSFALDVMKSAKRSAERSGIMRRLVNDINETCNFTMLDGNQVLYLDRVETSMPLRLHLESGIHMPLHCTASGKLFLSQLTPKHVYRLLGKGPYERYTPNTIVDPKALEEQLKRVRADMYSIDNRETDPDSVCLAVPVVEAKGRVYAAVAVHGPGSRMAPEKAMQYLPALRSAAAAIAETLVAVD